MTAAATLASILLLAGFAVGYNTDRKGLQIFNGILLTALAVIGLVLFAPYGATSEATRKFVMYVGIVAGVCVPMTSIYYFRDRVNAFANFAAVLKAREAITSATKTIFAAALPKVQPKLQ